MAQLELKGIAKRFGNTAALESIDLRVEKGEFLTLLGASGCGKSTTLRIIAGLVEPDAGQVLLDGEPVHNLPIHKRETALVFQSYALFPHMTVAQNVAFGPEMQQIGAAEIRTRVAEVLDLVELSGLHSRYPRQLSGGQQQRVALARAVVTRPKVLLLDEPLSNLDAKLRDRLRIELRELQQRLGLTTIYVTHDQAEALSLSDRVVFMAQGRIVEVGTPASIYRSPRSLSTANFLGVANLVKGKVATTTERTLSLTSELGQLSIQSDAAVRPGDQITLCFRPEDIAIDTRPDSDGLRGTVRHVSYLGALTDYVVELKGSPLVLRVHVPGPTTLAAGDAVAVKLPSFAAVIPTGSET
jgi:putative spermidine/putrescine transport system ATP-binding protein